MPIKNVILEVLIEIDFISTVISFFEVVFIYEVVFTPNQSYQFQMQKGTIKSITDIFSSIHLNHLITNTESQVVGPLASYSSSPSLPQSVLVTLALTALTSGTSGSPDVS